MKDMFYIITKSLSVTNSNFNLLCNGFLLFIVYFIIYTVLFWDFSKESILTYMYISKIIKLYNCVPLGTEHYLLISSVIFIRYPSNVKTMPENKTLISSLKNYNNSIFRKSDLNLLLHIRYVVIYLSLIEQLEAAKKENNLSLIKKITISFIQI